MLSSRTARATVVLALAALALTACTSTAPMPTVDQTQTTYLNPELAPGTLVPVSEETATAEATRLADALAALIDPSTVVAVTDESQASSGAPARQWWRESPREPVCRPIGTRNHRVRRRHSPGPDTCASDPSWPPMKTAWSFRDQPKAFTGPGIRNSRRACGCMTFQKRICPSRPPLARMWPCA